MIYDNDLNKLADMTEKMQQNTTETAPDEFPGSRIDYTSDGLPREEPNLDYYQYISFEEMASALCEDILQLDTFAVIKNRFSQSYLELCQRLEKGLAELAGFCVTRAVFEKKGIRFTKLDDLKLNTLSGIAGYHFRKTHDAVSKTLNKNQKFWIQMLDMEFRWYNLSKRIKATADRIELIRAGKINVDTLVEKLTTVKPSAVTSAAKSKANETLKALPNPKAISFPVMGEFIRSELNVQFEAIPAEPQKVYESAKKRKKAERLARKHAEQNQNRQNAEKQTKAEMHMKESSAHTTDQEQAIKPDSDNTTRSYNAEKLTFPPFVPTPYPPEMLMAEKSPHPHFFEEALRKLKRKRV